MKEIATIGLQKNEEGESVTPDIGVTDEQFYAIALDACWRVAWCFIPIAESRTAPATRAAIALGLRNTLREIEAQATDEARVAEEEAAKGVGLEPRGFDRATLDALVFRSHPGVKGAQK